MPLQFSDVQQTIARHWGFTSLRPMQEQAIQTNLAGKSMLVVLPTGGGKSLCFQAPAACRENQITVVVSPLIALMKDQVDSLNANGVPACFINSSLTAEERDDRIEGIRNGDFRLVYVAPERLVMEDFVVFLQRLPVASFAIDEAHCISHWGHDFRPEYRQLSFLRTAFPKVPVHAFTATATEKVRQDIIQQLGLEAPNVFIGDFHRPNLHYRVVARQNEWSQVKSFLEDRRGQAGIIYCFRRKDVDELVKDINSWGFKAMGYHAGMDAPVRKKVQDAFRNEKCNLICATVAFGMGIDRPDVRFVLHMTLPKSIEHYQQESGRAGRDGLDAECVLLYSKQDVVIWSKLIITSAEEAGADPAWTRSALAHLDEMDRYAKLTICRHRQLVNHFGQQFVHENCSACDVCTGDAEQVPDSLVIAQKLLSAVARCEERFGPRHLIEVVRGEKTEGVLKYGHDQLSVFGLLGEPTKDQVRDWFDQLASLGLLRKEEFVGQKGSGFILKLTPEAWKVMRKQRTDVKLWRKKSVEPLRKRKTRRLLTSLQVDEGLFAKLQQLRRHLAGIRGVAPYVICHDTTLNALASIRPTNRENLLAIAGFGEAKVNSFGREILNCIKEYCTSNRLQSDLTEGGQSEPVKRGEKHSNRTAPGQEDAWPLFQKGMLVEEASVILRKAHSTVNKYLEHYLEATPMANPEPWLSLVHAEEIREAAAQLNDGKLSTIFSHFEGRYSYEQIRIALAWVPLALQ
ncbi:MAG: DNA helicase RecQ [Gemmatales bacterium]